SAGQAVFDTDANGNSYGSAIETEAGPGPDSDGDGIDDSYEEQFFPGDLTQLGPGDFDGDGVNDPVEFADGTDPTEEDSDSDGSSDGEEKSNGTDPLAEDSDNDGLADGVESDSGVFDGPDDTGTDPLDSDTDDDGLLDGAETNTAVFNGPTDTGTDPLDPDTDGDTFTDGDEVSVGFDPNDEDSHPRSPLAPSGALHLPESILYRRTDGLNVGGDDFTGELPQNIDEEEPRGEIDDPDTSIISAIDVDREPGNGGIDLTGDNHDLAFTFQFYDADGAFSFTENYDDRVQVTITPIASARDLTETAAPVVHQNTGWNARTNAVYDFGAGGWFDARIIMSEDGGGAQSAADIGFGFNATGSNGGAGDFGGIGYVPSFGASAGQAVFDTDANGDSWGSLIIVPESIDAYQFKVSSPDGGVNLEFSWNSFVGQEYSIVSTNDLEANPNSSTWSVVPGLEGIAATPPRNVISIPKPLDPVRFYKLIGGPIPPLFFDDFESGQGGWTTRENDQERNTLWELGIPSGTTGPLSGANNSANAWSTNLGDYGPNSDISLRSPAINLGNMPSAQVTFDVFRDADGFADTAVVRFLRAADEVQLGPDIAMDMTIFDLDWVTLNIAVVPEAIGEIVIIEWHFVSDGSLDSFSGFSIDNVGIDVN
ncbi:MAG: choice-of-anchor J domain-containing protein, partial [Roseibacillus sp.]